LVSIRATGAIRVNGTISANGDSPNHERAGGGSGGGILLEANLISGSGSISANGGSGEPDFGGGGGGGSIALVCGTNEFTGSISAFGGAGYQAGGAGTVFVKTTMQTNGVITVDNGGRAGADTPVYGRDFGDLIVGGGGNVQPKLVMGNLTVLSNSWLSMPASATPFSLSVESNAVFAAGGGINRDGLGYPANQGPGMGSSVPTGVLVNGGGAGHAGYGGDGLLLSSLGNVPRGGRYYDNSEQPVIAGSGGGGYLSSNGGAGGGAVRLMVKGSLRLDGVISVNGNSVFSGGGGGGSGGSIWISAKDFSGPGRLSANGGSGGPGGPGGGGSGGCIAVDCNADVFTGIISATGGSGAHAGAAGTIYLDSGRNQVPQVIVDNGGLPGTNTITLTRTIDLIVQNGGVAAGSTSFRNLYIGPQSKLLPSLGLPAVATVTASHATIAAGGALTLTGRGYRMNTGPGSGRSYSSGMTSCGSGAGHGGYGGTGALGASGTLGGSASALTPRQLTWPSPAAPLSSPPPGWS